MEQLEYARLRLLANLEREIRNPRVLQAMGEVHRELFVPLESRYLAYEDIPLPIGQGQTISQPTIVAIMTAALELQPRNSVLELGTGSGYQAAILSRLAAKVVSVELNPLLANAARSRLQTLGYTNVEVRSAGTVLGCPEMGPFDAIVVTASAPDLPKALLEQLVVTGRMVIPVGSLQEQDLTRVIRTSEGYSVQTLGPCRFVPLIGPGAWEG